MADNTATFARRINRRVKNWDRNTERLRKAVLNEMLTEVVTKTPADKGVARSNWRVGVNSAPQGVLTAYAPGKNLGLSETANASAAISLGQSVIASSTQNDILYLVNNVPYIGRLNDGYSKQAPANFINLSLDRARKRVQRARDLFK